MRKKERVIQETRRIKVNNSSEGMSLEEILRRNKDGAGIELQGTKPLLYSLRKDGVIAQADIRHDKWEDAIMAHDAIARLKELKREEYDKNITEPKTETTQGTSGDAK